MEKRGTPFSSPAMDIPVGGGRRREAAEAANDACPGGAVGRQEPPMMFAPKGQVMIGVAK